MSFHELVALYRIADVCLVTSTRDGMNLVAYEYIATQQEKHGVLILSEFAGAAQSLKGSSILLTFYFKVIRCNINKSLEYRKRKACVTGFIKQFRKSKTF